VVLKRTDYFFGIYPNVSDYNHEKFIVEFSPGKDQMKEDELCGEWGQVCYAFVQYLSFLERETSIADPWAAAEEFSKNVGSLPNTAAENTPISQLERKAIFEALGNIQGTLLEYTKDSAAKMAFVVQQMSVLKDAATKFGRKDYLMLLYSTVIGVAISVGVPPHVGTEILQTLKESVAHTLMLS
jgi:hypothetical protein